MFSKSTAELPATLSDRTFVIAAVSVVLPWSTWPMVPMLQWGSELSGGMQKRVGFARAIVTNPGIILYDEPTAGLDPVTSTLIEDYIVQLKKELNAACIVVTHQLSTIQRAVDYVIMLYQGKIVFKGSVNQLLSGENEYARQFVSASIKGPMNMATK